MPEITRSIPHMAICAIAIAGLLDACGDAKTPLVVYSPHGRELLGATEETYEREHPEIDLQWYSMGAEVGLERIRSERGNPQADLWWGGPDNLFEQAEREELLAPYEPSWAAHAPRGSFSPTHAWYGTFQTVKGIGYNDEALTAETAPQDWDDLLDPKWRDKIIIRSPMESGTMKSVFAAMVYRAYAEDGNPDRGYDWLAKLDANTKAYVASPAALMLAIGRREGLVTLWDLTDILLQRREQNVPMAFLVPRSGALVLNEGIAVVRGAPHPELAKEFYEYVTSKKALLWQAENYFRVPTRQDIAPAEKPDWLRDLAIRELPVDGDAIGAHRDEWLQHWEQAIKGRGRR